MINTRLKTMNRWYSRQSELFLQLFQNTSPWNGLVCRATSGL